MFYLFLFLSSLYTIFLAFLPVFLLYELFHCSLVHQFQSKGYYTDNLGLMISEFPYIKKNFDRLSRTTPQMYHNGFFCWYATLLCQLVSFKNIVLIVNHVHSMIDNSLLTKSSFCKSVIICISDGVWPTVLNTRPYFLHSRGQF